MNEKLIFTFEDNKASKLYAQTETKSDDLLKQLCKNNEIEKNITIECKDKIVIMKVDDYENSDYAINDISFDGINKEMKKQGYSCK